MKNNIKILSLNISEKKGTIKKPVEYIEITENGIAEDAHAGNWTRQVSLLGIESIAKYEKKTGQQVSFGEFAENITTEGIPLSQTAPLDRFVSGKIILEVTQIGKKCHGTSCNIFKEVGNCIMPKEGIFCRVIQGGKLKKNDELVYIPKIFKVRIITLSDRASKGEYEDLSGKSIYSLVQVFMKEKNWSNAISRQLIPDEKDKLAAVVEETVNKGYDILITTGGTGIGPRDITPDTIRPMLDKEIPGIMEVIRVKYGMEKHEALLSRSIAGIIKNTLVFCLPGSVKAVKEYMREILKILEHSIYMLHNIDVH